MEESTDRTGQVAHYRVENDRSESSFQILQKGVLPKSKVTVRQVAILANLRIHTAVARGQCSTTL
jgi:hypothetical protein